jgi:hypothetical protein
MNGQLCFFDIPSNSRGSHIAARVKLPLKTEEHVTPVVIFIIHQSEGPLV